jgi:tetratricopeptide (TPR) repeat protein
MNRTMKLKIGAVLAIAVVGGSVGLAIFLMKGGAIALVGATLLVLIPGRIQGFYYRDFFTGRRLLDGGKFAEAIPYLERFLESIRQHPQRELLLWLSWSVYTPSVVAMALNNIGVARLNLGDVDIAESNFLRALKRDPLYPLPHFNLAIVWELRGDRNNSLKAISKAHQLGYTGGTIDVIINKSQSLLARMTL